MKTRTEGDSCFYLLAALCGIGAGWADVTINDLLFTALLVLASCMLLGSSAAAVAMALGGCGGGIHSVDRTRGLRHSNREAVAGADLRVVPGISSGHRGSLRGIDHAQRDRKPAAGEVGHRLPGGLSLTGGVNLSAVKRNAERRPRATASAACLKADPDTNRNCSR